MNTSNLVKGKKILLIGGAGFIGHHLALAMNAEGADVTIADSLSINSVLTLLTEKNTRTDTDLYRYFLAERFNLLRNARIPVLVGDFCDRYYAAKILSENYDTVYLLAAVAHASRSNTEPVVAMENSLLPLHNVASELCMRPDTRLVFLSSSTVYGHFKSDTVDENTECNPFGMYAVLKHVGERILSELACHSALNHSVVRPSALYGERCISRRVSQIFAENAIAERPLIFGGDRDERLDFTYINDLVQGLILAGLHDNAKGEIFNITYGDAQPVLTLVEILREYFPSLNFELKERNQATPVRGTLLNKKARTMLGFSPAYDLNTGYRKYVEWYLERKDILKFDRAVESVENE